MKERYIVEAGPNRHTVEVREVGDHYEVTIDDIVHTVDSSRIPNTSMRSLIIGGKSYQANTVQDGDRCEVYLSGEVYPVTVMDELWARAQEGHREPGSAGEDIKAPIPGSIVKILVKEGDTVAAGDPVAVLEAMKMQNELQAVNGGVVAEIRAKVGETVPQGQSLILLKPA